LDPYELLQGAYAIASGNIYDKSEGDSHLKGMGTTAITALFYKNKLYVANVGDSRAYLIHPPHIWQLSEDHSLLNEQIRAGLLRPDQAGIASTRNVITRSVGFERQVACDVIERNVEVGDCFLICSDGLSGQVTDRRICDVCLTLPFQDVPSRLVEEAKRNGGDDNITVVFMQAVADD
jgi:PPM family protein phosphatase